MPTTSSSTTRLRSRNPRRHPRAGMLTRMLEPGSALQQRWERLKNHPQGELALGAGLLGALAILAVPPRGWAALGGALFGSAAWLVRAPVGAVVIGVFLAKVWSDPDTFVPVTHVRTDR